MLEGIVTSIVGSTVGSFVQVGISKLFDIGLIQSENVDQKLKRMEYTLSTVRYSIHSTEATQIAYQEWQNLLQEFEDVGYDVEDLTDLKKADLVRKSTKSEIDDVIDRLKDILKSLRCLPHSKVRKPLTTCMMDDRLILGRESDKHKVIAMLNAQDQRSSNLTIVSILGIVGVGKTTLAQLVYNHDGYTEPFHYKVWFSVPTKYNAFKLTGSILDEVLSQSQSRAVKGKGTLGKRKGKGTLGTFQLQLNKLLQKKKLLLVLDDVHNFDKEQWDLLLAPLKDNSIVSKIIVTTGSPVVSKQLLCAYSTSQYDLKFLTDERVCASLLTREALGSGNADKDQKLLESLAKEISKRCKGLPLAIKIVGGLLRVRVGENEWKRILRSRISDNHEIKGEIVSAVRWGYCGVPLRLRQAFAYCSMFPNGYEFEKDKIIKMWMGEGLIVSDQEMKTLEDTGSSYIDQLLEYSFLQRKGSRYIIKGSVHNLAQSVFGKRFLEFEKTENPSKNTRHLLSTHGNIRMMTSGASNTCKGIRTLLLSGAYTSRVEDVRLDLLNFEKLRVLDLSGTQITEVTECIGNWKHLRFLDLSNTLLKLLPGKMVNLCVLQTLRLVNCSKLFCLPADIGKLESLRHLELGRNNLLSSMPSGIGNLTSLQTINEFIVSPTGGQLRELGNMNSIRGSLCIKKLENAQDSGTESGAKLSDKIHLDKLELRWSTAGNAVKSQKVLGHLMSSPHRSLKELILTNYGGSSFPGWISDPLSHRLTTICINDCPNCILLPCLGNLPNLKSLKIIEMPMLKKVDGDFLGQDPVRRFQCLEILEFSEMPLLSSWVGLGDNYMSLLRILRVVGCPSLNTIPSLRHLRLLEELEFTDCPALEIRNYLTAEQLLLGH